MKQTLEVLRQAAVIMSNNGPEKWTHGVAARDSEGNAVPVYSEAACRWSVLGYVDHVGISRHILPGVVNDAIGALTRAARGFGYQWVDDVDGYHKALAVLNEARREVKYSRAWPTWGGVKAAA